MIRFKVDGIVDSIAAFATLYIPVVALNLPGADIFVNTGCQIGKIDSLSGILSSALIFSLVLLGIFPIVMRRSLAYFRKQSNAK